MLLLLLLLLLLKPKVAAAVAFAVVAWRSLRKIWKKVFS